MTDRLSLVQSPCTTSDQEMEQIYSYNPKARTGPHICINNSEKQQQKYWSVYGN